LARGIDNHLLKSSKYARKVGAGDNNFESLLMTLFENFSQEDKKPVLFPTGDFDVLFIGNIVMY